MHYFCYVISKFKKYFVSALSSLLMVLVLLSNFSFAASYMLCKMDKKMNKAGFTSRCSEEMGAESGDIVSGLIIDTKDMNCCKIAVKELANTNNLITSNNQLKQNINSSPAAVSVTYNNSLNTISQNAKLTYFGDRISPPDIRIAISSFLI